MNRKEKKVSLDSAAPVTTYDSSQKFKRRNWLCKHCRGFIPFCLIWLLVIYNIDFTPDCNLSQFPEMKWNCKTREFGTDYCNMWTLEDNDAFLRKNSDIYFLGDSRTRNLMFTLAYLIDPLSLPMECRKEKDKPLYPLPRFCRMNLDVNRGFYIEKYDVNFYYYKIACKCVDRYDHPFLTNISRTPLIIAGFGGIRREDTYEQCGDHVKRFNLIRKRTAGGPTLFLETQGPGHLKNKIYLEDGQTDEHAKEYNAEAEEGVFDFGVTDYLKVYDMVMDAEKCSSDPKLKNTTAEKWAIYDGTHCTRHVLSIKALYVAKYLQEKYYG